MGFPAERGIPKIVRDFSGFKEKGYLLKFSR
jgi:hypothetical protein